MPDEYYFGLEFNKFNMLLASGIHAYLKMDAYCCISSLPEFETWMKIDLVSDYAWRLIILAEIAINAPIRAQVDLPYILTPPDISIQPRARQAY